MYFLWNVNMSILKYFDKFKVLKINRQLLSNMKPNEWKIFLLEIIIFCVSFNTATSLPSREGIHNIGLLFHLPIPQLCNKDTVFCYGRLVWWFWLNFSVCHAEPKAYGGTHHQEGKNCVCHLSDVTKILKCRMFWVWSCSGW